MDSAHLQYAREKDHQDPLGSFRQSFFIPGDAIYVDGNSLGLLSVEAEQSLLRVLDEWKQLGIRGWLGGQRPWFYFAEEMGELASGLVGAEPGELIFTGTTTVNIHSIISTFYQPVRGRSKILADALAFPSDIYALKGQIKQKGLDPEEELILVPSADGKTLREEDIVDLMGPGTALAWLPSVVYTSGQLLDMELLCREAKSRDILIGFDCSHSAGAVPHQFNRWGVDFATFCSYKYLNGGPGCSAFLYINKKHFHREPLLAGWFGYVKEKQFDMLHHFEHSRSAGGWQISSPGILGSATMEGSLQIIQRAGMDKMRKKSLDLTGFFLTLYDALLSDPSYRLSVDTPRAEHRRGGHIALSHPTEAFRINEALKARNIIPDFRAPDIIRIAPVALYNRFEEVYRVALALKEIMASKAYERFGKERKAIS